MLLLTVMTIILSLMQISSNLTRTTLFIYFKIFCADPEGCLPGDGSWEENFCESELILNTHPKPGFSI